MTGVIATIPKFQFSASGVPMVLGTLTVYLAGTTTPTDTWQDSALSTLNTNPVVLDARGECVLWLDSTKSYKFVLKNAAGATQWTEDNISGAASASVLASTIGAGMVGFDATLNYVAGTLGAAAFDTIINVKMFPWLAKGDGSTDDTAAIQAAITVMAVTGGTLKFPRGGYVITGLTVPATVYLEGDGERATSLLYAGSGNAVLCGGTAATLYYHLGVKNMRIIMTHVSATAVLAKGTCGGKFHDLYIEGPLTYPRTTRGVVFDGGNASSFFNDVRNVMCNHVHTGFELQSTGTVESTAQFFTNCTTTGDVASDPTSSCLLVNTDQGNGTVWMGGNAESCGQGFYYAASAGSVSVYGARLEGNTYDIYLNLTPNAQSFFGLINLDQAKIYDASGTGWDKHTFVGCIDVAQGNQNAPYNVWPGTQRFKSLGAAITPIRVIAYPGQTAYLQKNETSGGTLVSGIDPDMNYFGNHFKFPTVQVPSTDPNAFDDYEEGTWTPVIGGTGGESGQTYGNQSGKYTKKGNEVTVTADVYLSAKGTITGNVIIKGLPFTCEAAIGAAVNIGYASLATATVHVAGTVVPNSTYAYLRIKTAAAAAPSLAAEADIANNTEIILSATYFV